MKRETFLSEFGVLMTMIGVAVGLGAVWRFPYMVGRFGGAAFVLFYLVVVLFIGIPALMAEWLLGRHTRRGTLGAYEKGGFPGGRYVGYGLFVVVFCGAAYYANAVGWVLFHGLAQLARGLGFDLDGSIILPPAAGFEPRSFLLQMAMTGLVILAITLVIVKGLRRGIERASRWIMPLVFVILIVLIIRSLTLPGSGAGVKWYLGAFRFAALTPSVMAAAMGMAFFSMSLGGSFMVIYGSYLGERDRIPRNAIYTGLGALLAGLLAGLAIFPAAFAFGLEPASGPSLIFSTLPLTFARIPVGWLFGLLFFGGLFGAAYLSEAAAFEVLVGGLVDNTTWSRARAAWTCAAVIYVLAFPTMINNKIFIPWDLVFGSGLQVLGSLFAVVTAVWFIGRSAALEELARGGAKPIPRWLIWWMRFAVPAGILLVGLNWAAESF